MVSRFGEGWLNKRNGGGSMVKGRLKKRGQYKIQQMAFMILAIFFFFILVGILFVGWQYASLKSGFAALQEEKALSALKVIADSTELNCDASEGWCIDKDKLIAFGENSELYRDFWSVASIEILMVFPNENEGEPILCPLEGCDYYVLYDSGQKNRRTYSAYVTVCETVDRSHEVCELAKLILGVKINENA